jgi:phenylacetate-CoA ligase
VELALFVEGSEEKREAIASSIHSQLLRLNSEFANYVPAEYQMPQVALAQTGDPDYFPMASSTVTRAGKFYIIGVLSPF